MEADAIKKLKKEIDKIVDGWLAGVVKDRFTQKPVRHKPKSLWDRLKQGMTNWWWGPNGDKYNPYAWRNRFGDELGDEGQVAGDPRPLRREDFDPSIFTLQEYMEIRGIVDSLEMRLDESGDFENLRLMSLLRSAAVSLKSSLLSAMSRHLANLSQKQTLPAGGEKPVPAGGGKPVPAGGGKPVPAGGGKPVPAGGGKPVPAGGGKPVPGVTAMKPKQYTEKKKKLEGFFKTIEDEKGEIITFAEIFYGFVSIYINRYKEKSKELKSWFRNELKKLNDLKDGDDEDSWRTKIVKSDEFIEDISRIIGISTEEVLDDMVEYLEK